YFDGVDRLNTFQATLIELAPGSGNFTIEFNYAQVQWEAGDSHGGNGGVGGNNTARVGFSLVPGDLGSIRQVRGSARPGQLLDGHRRALVTNTNTGTPGRYRWTVRAGRVR